MIRLTSITSVLVARNVTVEVTASLRKHPEINCLTTNEVYIGPTGSGDNFEVLIGGAHEEILDVIVSPLCDWLFNDAVRITFKYVLSSPNIC